MTPVFEQKETNGIVGTLCKSLLMLLFYITPRKFSSIFVHLSILAVVYKIKNINFDKVGLDIDKMSNLLRLSIHEEILLLPNYTIYWIWGSNFLSSTISIHNKKYTVKEAIMDESVFFPNIRVILDAFIDNLPSCFKFKLRLKNKTNVITLKHNIIYMLMHA